MKLLYKNEHLNCLNYDGGDRPAFEFIEIGKEELFEENPRLAKIIFLLKGKVTYSFGAFNGCPMKERQMLFIPPDYHFTFTGISNACLLVIRMRRKIQFCETYMMESLAGQTRHLEEDSRNNTDNMPFMLSMNRAMDIYTEGLLLFMRKGLCCRYYFETKAKELFYLLRAFYPKEELARFFRMALSLESSFSYFVNNNYHRFNTLSELAAAMNMSLSSFEKRFRKVFGTSGYKWMNRHKARKIYHAICNEDCTFSELSIRFGFASKSSFSDFCKKNLGFPPGQIRKKCASRTK